MRFPRPATMSLTLIAVALLGGCCLAFQSGMNSTLARSVGHAITASAISFTVGAAALLAVVAVGIGWPAQHSLGTMPRWAWMGGLCGAVYVSCMTFAAGRLGATTTAGLVVSGQLCAAVVLDHFGWVGFPVHAISAARLLGVVLLGLGVYLIRNN